MVLSASTWALIKLCVVFGGILIFLRLHRPLWQAVTLGCILILIMNVMPLRTWWEIPLTTLYERDFLIMECMVFGILILSGIQGATGQSQRLVEALDRYLRWPRIRIIVFPALVGLLPMPGGALFSCPMLDAAAHGMEVSPKRKVLINYWFRHMWEIAWPLYPGYILASSLLGLSLLTLLKYTFPLVIFSFITGWFFFIRDIKVVPDANTEPVEDGHGALGRVLYESLPMLIAIGGAGIVGIVLTRFLPWVPAQMAFILSLSAAIAVAVWQGRGRFKQPLRSIILSPSMVGMLALIMMIFIFKNLTVASGIVADISQVGESMTLVYLMFIILPFVCGALTGVMVGYVGPTFPILIGILAQSGLQAQALPLIILALVAGNVGQLATPLHVCIVVTCEYFKVRFFDLWPAILWPLLVQMGYGITWALLLYAIGAHF